MSMLLIDTYTSLPWLSQDCCSFNCKQNWLYNNYYY